MDMLKQHNDIIKVWSCFRQTYDSLVDRYIPRRQPSHHIPAPTSRANAYNHTIRKAVKRKHRLWQRYMETRDPSKYKAYTMARNTATRLIRNHHTEMNKKLAGDIKENPKKFWAHINKASRLKEHIPALLYCSDVDGSTRTTSNNIEKATALSNFFASVYIHEPPGELPSIPSRHFAENLSTLPITEELVLRKLSNIKTHKSAGNDNIHPKVLKELRQEISSPLTFIFNLSLHSATLPLDWKVANITAIHKKDQKTIPDNYRPISLTSTVCKILESIVGDSIMNHLQTNNLLSNRQYGFRKSRSTALQMLCVMDL